MCKNGALIEWVDKETIRYTKMGFLLIFGLIFEEGFLNVVAY